MRAHPSSALATFGALVAFVALVSCDDATTPDEATDARLHVKGGQFFRGAMPEAESGPNVKSVTLTPKVVAGSSGRQCSGELEGAATSVALSLDGDHGYWIVPAGLPTVSAPGIPTFTAELAYAATLAGTMTLLARAVDAQGNFGRPFTRPLVITAKAPPKGHFVVALSWDNEADLDLHVVDPRGVEIFNRNISSYQSPPPGSPPEPPNTPHPGGILDFDSNAMCVPDGRHAEDVVYATIKPPSGHYIVRVDTASLCGEAGAHWRVEGFLEGVSMGAAEGSSTEFDARFPHERGAGVLALELDVP